MAKSLRIAERLGDLIDRVAARFGTRAKQEAAEVAHGAAPQAAAHTAEAHATDFGPTKTPHREPLVAFEGKMIPADVARERVAAREASERPAHTPEPAKPPTPAAPSQTSPATFVPGMTAKQAMMLEGVRALSGQISGSGPIKKALLWATGVGVASSALFLGGGKALEAYEINSSGDPGTFSTLSTIHYTQGYDLRASNGSEFQSNVEIGRKNRDPKAYVSRYDEKSEKGWIPTEGAREAYTAAKSDLMAADQARAETERAHRGKVQQKDMQDFQDTMRLRGIYGAARDQGYYSVDNALEILKAEGVITEQKGLRDEFSRLAFDASNRMGTPGKLDANGVAALIEDPRLDQKVLPLVSSDIYKQANALQVIDGMRKNLGGM